MTLALDRYQLLGLSLISFGAVFASYSYLVLLSVPLTALGLACIILGSTLLMVPGSPVPKHQVRAMMEGSLVNVEALLEEFDVKGKAVYLPPNEGRVFAFIPVQESVDLGAIDPRRVPVRVLSEAGGVRGVTVFPPGSEAVRLSLLPGEVGAEDALNHVLVDFIEAVESVKFVRRGVEAVVAERLRWRSTPRGGPRRTSRCTGVRRPQRGPPSARVVRCWSCPRHPLHGGPRAPYSEEATVTPSVRLR